MAAIVRRYPDRARALAAAEAAVAAGVPREDVGIATPHVLPDAPTDAEGDAVATGAMEGGLLGGVAGVLAGTGVLTLPILGSLLVMGPLLPIMAGVAMGATAGGLAGTLIGWGLPKHEADAHHDALARGETLLTIHPPAGREAEVLAAIGGV